MDKQLTTETEYMNDGPRVALLKLAMDGGYEPTDDEAIAIEAHSAMPRGVFYTQSQVDAKKREIQLKRNWDSMVDGYEDLYGPYVPPSPSRRRSAYDRKHFPLP